MRVALVVPTCRPASLARFLAAWEPVKFWDELVVMEDRDDLLCDIPGPLHVSHFDARMDLGADAWIISRRDSACRSYGIYRAWKAGADLIVTLDDDCLPVAGQDYLAEHIHNFRGMPRWITSVPGLVPRGLPYRNRGTLGDVAISMGLWRGVPDLDGARSLVEGCPDDYIPPEGRWLIPAGQYAPICGMNVAFRRDVSCLAYFGLQGEGWPYRRFDDIWMGVVAKKILDFLGLRLAVGRPWVRHERASDPVQNAAKEGPGLPMNERFWETIDAIRLVDDTPAGCMIQVGYHLSRDADPYLARLGAAIETWGNLFR